MLYVQELEVVSLSTTLVKGFTKLGVLLKNCLLELLGISSANLHETKIVCSMKGAEM